MSEDKFTGKTELRGRLSYALTDGCGNLLYCIIGSFLLYFYTDVFGLSVAVTGTLLLATRLMDAIDAPLWGFIVDHTKTKYGQSRPYFLWLCVPFAVFMWLTFNTPDLSGTAKVAYAAVTYIAAGVIYTGIQTAITSILTNLSHNSEERVVLNTFRMVGGNVGAFICMTFTLPLVAYFGGGNDQLGFSMTLAFFGVIVAVLLFVAFRNLREVNVEKIKRIPIKDSIRAIKGNWPWMILVAANLIFWIVLTIRQSTVVYYCQYVLGDKGIAAMINGFMVIQVLGMLSIPFLVNHTSKHTTMIIGFVLAILGHIGMYFAGVALSVLVPFWCISCIGIGWSSIA